MTINKKKIAIFSLIILAVASIVFVACNDEQENEIQNSTNKKADRTSISEVYSMQIHGIDYDLYITNDTLRMVINTAENVVYRAPQVIICDSKYAYTERGELLADNRVNELKKMGIPCTDYYLAFNKRTQRFEYLVLYTTEEPCDWMDEIVKW